LPPFILGIGASIFMLIFYIINGSFTPYKSVGFAGIYLVSLALLLFIVGFLADTFMHIKRNLDKVLYFEKRQYYESKARSDEEKYS